ncbi:leucyl/phenylalanyl-tRNA--protein transferase [Apibacter raozihei]|uniref:leucyl/phenylalanyl-tRNA--protein transferase n=1 Tax=Apibacter raozihei TaxID=2500547 RepID=UPI000FE2FC85|nr:leucyl/phenylalanyl-tRNA--protein transferase [Apibacter raozihei]
METVYLLNEKLEFPETSLALKNGLLAIGGDLSPERVLLAYKSGIFPWFNSDEIIQWWAPDPRFILFPKEIKISKSTRRLLSKNHFRFTENLCFEKVIRHCASVKREGQDGTWITEDMIEAYIRLHRLGIAKSLEVWENTDLVGGFYGIDLVDVFCGESMFSLKSNASKCGFTYFAEKYKDQYKVIDCQIYSTYLAQLGACEISLKTFKNYLDTDRVKNLHFKE